MEWLSTLDGRTTVSTIADTLSVITFILTIYVFFAIRQVKNRYLFRARVPELIKKLAKQASKLSALSAEFDSSRKDIDVLVGEMDVSLLFLKKKISWKSGRSINRTRNLIKKYGQTSNKETLWDIYPDVQKVIAELNQVVEDSKWDN